MLDNSGVDVVGLHPARQTNGRITMITTQTYQLTRHEALLAIEGLRMLLDTETNIHIREAVANLIDYMEGVVQP